MPHDDFEIEPIRGLPERPPAGETILWQGSPQPWALAKAALKVHWIAGYFVFLAVLRGTMIGAEAGAADGLVAASWYLAIGAVAVGVLAVMGWVMAREAVYTLTSRRVVMRVGAALTVTFNVPYQWIDAADLELGRNGVGTIALRLKGETRLSYLALWPHARPWAFRAPQPALRAIPGAEHVAEILGAAARSRIAEVEAERTPAPAHSIAAE